MSDWEAGSPLVIASITLPNEVVTRNGIKFNPRNSRWSYRDNTVTVSLDFSTLIATSQLITSAKKVLIWYAENRSPDHLCNMFSYFKRFINHVSNENPISEIQASHILNYRSNQEESNLYLLGNISGFFRKWHSLSIEGVSDDAVALLKQLRLKGNLKGEAVSTMDVLNGPFSDLEVDALHEAVEIGYQFGDINLDDYLLIWLFLALGQRPIQFAALKICDFNVSQAKDGTVVYTLSVPRAKQREQMTRSVFSQRVLVPKIGEKFVQYIEIVRAKYVDLIGDVRKAPLFPAKRSNEIEPVGFEFHRTSQGLAQDLKNALNKLNVISERTGEPLHITATRFRRTLGTRAAMEGHGELVIAELLDHTDTQNVGVYVQATPEIVERIDRAMAMQLAPLAQAFVGVIIKGEAEAKRGNDPESRIVDPRFDATMKPMGNCGQHGFCGELAPIACYTCQNFQPWLDGPHEAVLNHLVSERERLMKATDARIASINDRTILAVAEVVRCCDEINDEKVQVNDG